MTSSASIPSEAAAQASACAWLPAEIPITPRAFSSPESDASLFSTPRGLNEPVRWKSSAFRWTGAATRAARVAELKTGVRCRRPRIVPAAATTSSWEITSHFRRRSLRLPYFSRSEWRDASPPRPRRARGDPAFRTLGGDSLSDGQVRRPGRGLAPGRLGLDAAPRPASRRPRPPRRRRRPVHAALGPGRADATAVRDRPRRSDVRLGPERPAARRPPGPQRPRPAHDLGNAVVGERRTRTELGAARPARDRVPRDRRPP